MDWHRQFRQELARSEADSKRFRAAFTPCALAALDMAADEAQRRRHDYIGAEHLLLALIGNANGRASEALASSGVDVVTLRSKLDEHLEVGTWTLAPVGLYFTPRMRYILDHALLAAKEQGLSRVAAEHLLLGLLRQRDGLPARIFEELGADVGVMRDQLLMEIPPHNQ